MRRPAQACLRQYRMHWASMGARVCYGGVSSGAAMQSPLVRYAPRSARRGKAQQQHCATGQEVKPGRAGGLDQLTPINNTAPYGMPGLQLCANGPSSCSVSARSPAGRRRTCKLGCPTSLLRQTRKPHMVQPKGYGLCRMLRAGMPVAYDSLVPYPNRSRCCQAVHAVMDLRPPTASRQPPTLVTHTAPATHPRYWSMPILPS